MIYRLDFNHLYEWANNNSANSKILESVHKLLPDSLLLFIPTQQDRSYHNSDNYRERNEYKFDIALELDAYDYQYYDMSNDSSLVQLKRELVLNSL